ncbi:MAG: hypothetical protein HRT43_11300 [Campylobacteraceae bacterium]|nr:hypothetical protein [Campylobacteraceae bacterium]
MTISVLVRFYVLVTLVFIFGYLGGIYISIAIICSLLTLLIKCPKCKKQIVITSSGMYSPIVPHICSKCGHNLLKPLEDEYLKTDNIIEIGIDKFEHLYIKPEKEKFLYIYREAMEVHWDDENAFCLVLSQENGHI